MARFIAILLCAVGPSFGPARAQIAMSGGDYKQDFDSLAVSGASNPWTDNSTLPGWYASRTIGGSAVTAYRAESGSSIAGALYSFGNTGSLERALGSVASGTPGNFAYGIRFTNDTATTQTNILISYTGEQWRNGGIAALQNLAFAYRISNSAITNSDAGNANTWISLAALDFSSPNANATAGPLDGNAATNQQVFVNVALSGVNVAPGQELFLRWFDVNDTDFDHGLALDALLISFNGTTHTPSAPVITTQPQSQAVAIGENVTFTVAATGYPPPAYQWQYNSSNLNGETNAALMLIGVTTNQAGPYTVTVTNSVGATNSQAAILTVAPGVAGFSLVTYNIAGNGATDWSTNAPQVQAIARQLQYLNPDFITFQEIPFDLRYEMTNFVTAFFPSYALAVTNGGDSFITSALLSRYPITRFSKWLDGIDLRAFGYSNADNNLDNFTRDLSEIQVNVPGFPQPLHLLTTHLKSTAGTTYADAAAKRAAEATAITNFIATNLQALYPLHSYVLTGDLNDSDTNALAIQKLISPATGLRLTNPTNPLTGSVNTFSIRASVSSRLDYILPGGVLRDNIAAAQVFRTDLLPSPPAPLLPGDSATASDHLPVLMVFNNPYDQPFRILSTTRSNLAVTLKWEAVPGQTYRVESSTNLTTWSALAGNLVATSNSYTFGTNLNDAGRYFRIHRGP
jgi:endonuclease/exonuclease/phosphatase family metal-dependent hydrolase